MKSKIIVSVVVASAISIYAQDLGTIEISEKVNTKVVDSINTKEVKNADLAEALAKRSSSVSLIRRSGIANDILLRGQKRDNIKVTIDNSVIHGACPNRMDPPTSHVITNMVESVEIKEGPFDVSEFGNLSGGVKINTIKPTKELSGEVGTTVGSYGYIKGLATISGGNDFIQGLISVSKEESDQYKDGDGKTLAEQTYSAVVGTPIAGTQYTTKYRDKKAYEKESLMAKINIDIASNQELGVSTTINRSKDILYPSSKMDARYDNSNIYSAKYIGYDFGDFSKKLEVELYKSDVDHPMDTRFRNSGATTFMTNHLTTDVYGGKVMNTFEALNREFTIGVDSSKREWDGRYYNSAGVNLGKSIDGVETINSALFLQCTNEISDKFKIELGLRYDDTKVESKRVGQNSNNYNTIGGNIVATFSPNKSTKYFVGVGQASRVPDGRELYNLGNSKDPTTQLEIGTPNLKETTNREIDIGAERSYEAGKAKIKIFYSDLQDYIYYRKTGDANRFENIDATIYGFELSGAYYINDELTFDASYSWKRGEKDSALSGQSDKDLADITPPKLALGLTYDYNADTFVSTDFIYVDSWNRYDSDNGEQKIDSYNVVNLKGQTTLAKNFELTIGVDNLFDKTYALSNTYSDLILLTDGTTNDVMLLNEPGRYLYASLKYKF